MDCQDAIKDKYCPIRFGDADSCDTCTFNDD